MELMSWASVLGFCLAGRASVSAPAVRTPKFLDFFFSPRNLHRNGSEDHAAPGLKRKPKPPQRKPPKLKAEALCDSLCDSLCDRKLPIARRLQNESSESTLTASLRSVCFSPPRQPPSLSCLTAGESATSCALPPLQSSSTLCAAPRERAALFWATHIRLSSPSSLERCASAKRLAGSTTSLTRRLAAWPCCVRTSRNTYVPTWRSAPMASTCVGRAPLLPCRGWGKATSAQGIGSCRYHRRGENDAQSFQRNSDDIYRYLAPWQCVWLSTSRTR